MDAIKREVLRRLKALSSHSGRIISEAEFRVSSVLIPLHIIPAADDSLHEDQVCIMYEKRSAHIPQGGEICFPGGRVEPGEGHKDAAVREFYEETGIDPSNIEHIVFFGSFMNPGGRLIHVWAGLIDAVDSAEPNEEVDQLFSWSVGRIHRSPLKQYQVGVHFDPENSASPIPFEKYGLAGYRKGKWRGHDMSVLFYEDLDDLLWGMTAKITADFIEQYIECGDPV